MASHEWIARALATHKSYEDLPAKVQATLPLSEWRARVKAHCIHRGFEWSNCNARTCCSEQEYYEELLRYYKRHARLFPYHMADYICRVMRVQPFRYYCDILFASLRDQKQYDQLPNFTAADIVQHVGVGRNEYIAILNQCKSKKLLWRVNKGIARDFFPDHPLPPKAESWWRVNVVNVGESEYRALEPGDKALLQAAAVTGGVPLETVDRGKTMELYAQGLVYFTVPIAPNDHVTIPPLEGFVSNKDSETSETKGDPLETLLYAVFVATSARASVAQLASMLSVDLAALQAALSVACRLGFASLAHPGGGGVAGSVGGGGVGGGVAGVGVEGQGMRGEGEDVDFGGEEVAVEDASSTAEGVGVDALVGGREEGAGVALVVDSEVTGYLMMGALSPGLKKHSVTLFEGGRITGVDVIQELYDELLVSIGAAAQFEGEMKHLAEYARGLAIALECIRACAPHRAPVEILRKENLAGLLPAAAYRVLAHAYVAIVPIHPLPYPPLPLPMVVGGKGGGQHGPTNLGPTCEAATPWLQLALWVTMKRGPPTLILAGGQRLTSLPRELQQATHALLWPFATDAVHCTNPPALLPAHLLLYSINEWLARTAIMVAPLKLPGGGAEEGPSRGGGTPSPTLATVDVPLPLDTASSSLSHVGGDTARGAEHGGRVAGVVSTTGDVVHVPLPPGCDGDAQHALGLDTAVGCVRMLQVQPGGGGMVVVVPPVHGDLGGDHETQRGDVADSADAADAATQSLQETPHIIDHPEAWIPLHMCLGLPLVPPALCAQVCARAKATKFLTAESRAAHDAGQRCLQSVLRGLMTQYALCSPSLTGNGGFDTLGCIDPPVYNLWFDGTTLHTRQHEEFGWSLVHG